MQQPMTSARVATPDVLGYIAEMIKRNGVSAIVMGYLVYWLTLVMGSEMRDMHKEMIQHISISGFYSRQICLNTSTTDNQKFACQQISSKAEQP